MHLRGVQLNVITYSSVISAWIIQKCEYALQLLVVVLLIAYKEGKRPDKAFELFRVGSRKAWNAT